MWRRVGVWAEEVKGQKVGGGGGMGEVGGGIWGGRVWHAGMSGDAEVWCEGGKARNLGLKPGRRVAEIAEGIRQRQKKAGSRKGSGEREKSDGVDWRRAMSTDPEALSEELKA